jgi:hypothetical protein
MDAKQELHRLYEEMKILKALMGDLWDEGDWIGIVWQSKDMRVIVARYMKFGQNGFYVHDKNSKKNGLYVDLGDPDISEKMRSEVRRLLDE